MSKETTSPSTTSLPTEPPQTSQTSYPTAETISPLLSIYSTEGTIPPPVEENTYPPVPEEVTEPPVIPSEITDSPIIPEGITDFPIVPEETTESPVIPEFRPNPSSFTVEENPLDSVANFESWWSQTSPILLKNLLESRFPIPKYDLESGQLS